MLLTLQYFSWNFNKILRKVFPVNLKKNQMGYEANKDTFLYYGLGSIK